jgi:hypothetical protein
MTERRSLGVRVDSSLGAPNLGEVSLTGFQLTGAEATTGWMSKGLCADVSVEERDDWFQDPPTRVVLRKVMQGKNPPMTPEEARAVRAIQICGNCPLREQCLAYAMEQGESFGIWGGVTASQRARDGNWVSDRCTSSGRMPKDKRTEIQPEVVEYRAALRQKQLANLERGRKAKRHQTVVGEGGQLLTNMGPVRPEGKCLSGQHDWIPENLVRKADGSEFCRKCKNERCAEARKRARKAESEKRRAQGLILRRAPYGSLEVTVREGQEYLDRGLTLTEAATAMGMRRETLARAFQRWNQKQRGVNGG